MMNMHMNNVTLDHEVENSDFKLIEAWLTNDTKKDKAYALGYELPSGSVMLSYKVINDKMWERVLNGEFNGFSIEGHDFDREEIDLSMNSIDFIPYSAFFSSSFVFVSASASMSNDINNSNSLLTAFI